jgi:hypothetical protein
VADILAMRSPMCYVYRKEQTVDATFQEEFLYFRAIETPMPGFAALKA